MGTRARVTYIVQTGSTLANLQKTLRACRWPYRWRLRIISIVWITGRGYPQASVGQYRVTFTVDRDTITNDQREQTKAMLALVGAIVI